MAKVVLRCDLNGRGGVSRSFVNFADKASAVKVFLRLREKAHVNLLEVIVDGQTERTWRPYEGE